jgi:type IV secretory pathway TrbF-like protein
MSLENRNSMDVNAELEPELRQALGEFRLSVHAWSEAAYSRERGVAVAAPRQSWRLAAGWALGFVLAVGGVSGGVYQRHHSQVLAQIAQQQEIERQKQAALEKERDEEALLASVDTDVSQEVPSAMEPLAQLMAEDESK